ncbi:MAG: hypothetical protein CMH30_06400 [Micavibrio sp.]|nr:hypothetical protein [Micavibrio sp.]
MKSQRVANKTALKIWFICSLLVGLHTFTVMAQTDSIRKVDQFTAAKAIPLGGDIIQTPNYIVDLWGIAVLTTNDKTSQLRARSALDTWIANSPIQCRVMQWKNNRAVSQCTNAQEQDLALALLREGLAYVDRSSVTAMPDIQAAYNEAEKQANKFQKGLWYDTSTAAVNILDFQNLRPDLKKNLFILLAVILFAPLLGFILMSFIMFAGFGRLIRLQKDQLLKSNKDASELKSREKVVLASSLEGELQANQSKIDAFVTIYKEQLKDLRNPNKTPKYKQSGDIIHEKPALMRMVYDANIDKINLLGPSIAGMLSRLYSDIETNPSYQTLEPEMPLNEAEAHIEKIVLAAQNLLPVIEKLLSGLNVVSRAKH